MRKVIRQIARTLFQVTLKAECNNSILKPSRRMKAGWYMLDINADLPDGQCTLLLAEPSSSDENVEFSLPLSSGKGSKRIFMVKDEAKQLDILSGSLPAGAGIIEASAVRLTENRAMHLMQKKIQAKHPVLATRSLEVIQKFLQVSEDREEIIALTWREYCSCYPQIVNESVRQYWFNHIQDVWHQNDAIFHS